VLRNQLDLEHQCGRIGIARRILAPTAIWHDDNLNHNPTLSPPSTTDARELLIQGLRLFE
jgi:hypothetical protein